MEKERNKNVREVKGIKDFKKEGDINRIRIQKYPTALAFDDPRKELRMVTGEVKLHLVEELQNTRQRQD